MIETRSYTLANENPPYDFLSERIGNLARERRMSFVYQGKVGENKIWVVHTQSNSTVIIRSDGLFPVEMHGKKESLDSDKMLLEALLQSRLNLMDRSLSPAEI